MIEKSDQLYIITFHLLSVFEHCDGHFGFYEAYRQIMLPELFVLKGCVIFISIMSRSSV